MIGPAAGNLSPLYACNMARDSVCRADFLRCNVIMVL